MDLEGVQAVKLTAILAVLLVALGLSAPPASAAITKVNMWSVSTYSTGGTLYWQRVARHERPPHDFYVKMLWNQADQPGTGCTKKTWAIIQGRRNGRTVWSMEGVGRVMYWKQHWTRRNLASWYRLGQRFNVRIHVNDPEQDCNIRSSGWWWFRP